MLTFDIPINIKVSAETEEHAEKLVTEYMERIQGELPALTNHFITWDFIEFVEGDEPDSEFFMGS